MDQNQPKSKKEANLLGFPRVFEILRWDSLHQMVGQIKPYGWFWMRGRLQYEIQFCTLWFENYFANRTLQILEDGLVIRINWKVLVLRISSNTCYRLSDFNKLLFYYWICFSDFHFEGFRRFALIQMEYTVGSTAPFFNIKPFKLVGHWSRG